MGALKLTAAAVKLLDLTLVRVGNASYARLNRSYGVTTLRDKHVTVEGGELKPSFRGKSGERHSVSVVSDDITEAILTARLTTLELAARPTSGSHRPKAARPGR